MSLALPTVLEFDSVDDLPADLRAFLGLHDAHVDAYWADVDADLQTWLDSTGHDSDDLDALVNAGRTVVAPALDRLHAAANAWRQA